MKRINTRTKTERKGTGEEPINTGIRSTIITCKETQTLEQVTS